MEFGLDMKGGATSKLVDTDVCPQKWRSRDRLSVNWLAGSVSLV